MLESLSWVVCLSLSPSLCPSFSLCLFFSLSPVYLCLSPSFLVDLSIFMCIFLEGVVFSVGYLTEKSIL